MSNSHRRAAVPLVLILVVSSFSAAAFLDGGADVPGSAPVSTLDEDGDDGHNATTTTVDGPDGTPIEITVFEPASASDTDPVPVILHGHGWGGEGWDEVSQAEAFLDAGYGVVSIDQRGHGNSGGQARVMDPEHEAKDVQAVIDHVAGLDWVEDDGSNDPVLGTMGGSYGGGYQLITALEAVDETGSTRIDAMAPSITWYDLARSLAPNRVVKSEWVDLLVAVAKAPPVTDTHPDYVDKPYTYTLATGDLPDGQVPGFEDITQEYRNRSPVSYVERGVTLDVPALFQQGMTDTLFPLDQAVANYRNTLSSSAQADSYVVGHTTGHVLPSAGPPQGHLQEVQGGDTPCADQVAGGQVPLLLEWFNHTLRDEAAALPSSDLLLPKEPGAGECVPRDNLPDGDLATADGPVAVASGPAGPPNLAELDADAGTLAGSPTLEASVTTRSIDTRFFVALAVGPNEAEAQVVDSQWRPVRLEGPATGAQVSVDLPDVVVDVGEDENVYLATASSLDMYAHHSSRTPGPVTLEDVQVTLPTVGSD